MSSPFPTSEAAFHASPDARACTASHAAGPGQYASRPPGLWLASICSAFARARVGVYGGVRVLESRSGSRGEKSLGMSSPMTIPVPTSQAKLPALPDERACTASHAAGPGRYGSWPHSPCLAPGYASPSRARALPCTKCTDMWGLANRSPAALTGWKRVRTAARRLIHANPSQRPGGHRPLKRVPVGTRPVAWSDLQRSGSYDKKRAEAFCLVFGHNY